MVVGSPEAALSMRNETGPPPLRTASVAEFRTVIVNERRVVGGEPTVVGAWLTVSCRH